MELSKGTKIIGQAAFLNTEIKSITLLPTVKIIGAYPRKTGREFTSGIEPQLQEDLLPTIRYVHLTATVLYMATEGQKQNAMQRNGIWNL